MVNHDREQKTAFLVYYNYAELVDELTDKQAGQLFKALFAHGANPSIRPDLDDKTFMVFMIMRQAILRNEERYAETCRKRSEAGKKGGRPKKGGEA